MAAGAVEGFGARREGRAEGGGAGRSGSSGDGVGNGRGSARWRRGVCLAGALPGAAGGGVDMGAAGAMGAVAGFGDPLACDGGVGVGRGVAVGCCAPARAGCRPGGVGAGVGCCVPAGALPGKGAVEAERGESQGGGGAEAASERCGRGASPRADGHGRLRKDRAALLVQGPLLSLSAPPDAWRPKLPEERAVPGVLGRSGGRKRSTAPCHTSSSCLANVARNCDRPCASRPIFGMRPRWWRRP